MMKYEGGMMKGKKNIKRIILLVLTLSRRKTKFLWQNGSFLLYFSKLKKKEIKRAKIAKKRI